jgi:glycosyltransferase involved in cell wall biosynthesis
MKRVLFVTYHFPPSVGGGIPRILSFSRDLVEYDWLPSVLTSPRQGRAAIDAQALATLPRNVVVTRAYCPLARAGVRGHVRVTKGAKGALRRSATFVSQMLMTPDVFAPWIPFALAAGRELLAHDRFDAVLATYGPPANLLVGALLAKTHGLPLVVDFRDLWSDLPFASFPSRHHRAIAGAIEHQVVARASAITTVSDGMSRHFRTRFGIAEQRVTTIHNGFDEDALTLIQDAGERRRADGPLRVCYSGAVYAAYDLSPFLAAVKSLADSGRVTPQTFRFHTIGNFPAELAAHHGVEAFHEHEPFMTRDRMFARFATMDAFLAVESGDYGAQFGYPVKAFDYVLTGKPILALVEPDGNLSRLLRELGRHHLHDKRDVDGIATSLLALAAARGVAAAPVFVDRPPLSRFRRRLNAKVLAGVLDRVCDPSPGEARHRVHSS